MFPTSLPLPTDSVPSLYIGIGVGLLTVFLVGRLFSSSIYDIIIVDRLTKKWYEAVLLDLPRDSVVLDIGIGTSTALIRNKSLLLSKNIRVIGVDYEKEYIKAAKQRIEQENLGKHIQVICKSVYDEDLRDVLALFKKTCRIENDEQSASKTIGEQGKKQSQGNVEFVDAVYFSGSWTLMPDPVEAVRVAAKLLNTHPESNARSKDTDQQEVGHVYITQTFQKRDSVILKYVKPLLKYLTTIDYGQLTKISDMEHYVKALSQPPHQGEAFFSVEKKEIIKGSINNVLQAAHLIKLRQQS